VTDGDGDPDFFIDDFLPGVLIFFDGVSVVSAEASLLTCLSIVELLAFRFRPGVDLGVEGV